MLDYSQIILSVTLWYSFSILATVINKRLLSNENAVFPLTLTFFHVLISCTCDSSTFLFLCCSCEYESFSSKGFTFLSEPSECSFGRSLSVPSLARHDVREVFDVHILRTDSCVADPYCKGVAALLQCAACLSLDRSGCRSPHFFVSDSDRVRSHLCLRERDTVVPFCP